MMELAESIKLLVCIKYIFYEDVQSYRCKRMAFQKRLYGQKLKQQFWP